MNFNSFFKYITKFSRKNNDQDSKGDTVFSLTENKDSIETIQKKKKIKVKYDKIKSTKEIALFESQAIDLIMNHLLETDYKNHQALLRETKFLLYYTFEILKDDYFVGEQFFKTKMTRIDDYIFSQYSKQDNLKEHIKKLRIVASSNRFDEQPRKNILSYFVFLEESGFEIIELLNDYYSLLEKLQGRRFFRIGKKMASPTNKKYKKSSNEINHSSEVLTLMTQQTLMFTPRNAQREIVEDLIAREKKH